MRRRRVKTVGIICFMLAMIFLSSCSSEQEKPLSVADIYRSTAQGFIDAEDYDSAIQALEEGVAATNDEGLIALLEEVKTAHEVQTGTDGETESPPDVTQKPNSEPGQEPTQEANPTQTLEPTPESTSEPPSVTVGKFDDFVGSWQDIDCTGGEGNWLFIGYEDETKQKAYARVSNSYSEYTVELATEDGETVYGHVTSGGSEPIFAIEISRYKYWLDASIYEADIGDETYIQFVANPDLASENPFYVG